MRKRMHFPFYFAALGSSNTEQKKIKRAIRFPFLRMTVDSENPLLFDVLTGSSSSYTANPDSEALTEVRRRNIV